MTFWNNRPSPPTTMTSFIPIGRKGTKRITGQTDRNTHFIIWVYGILRRRFRGVCFILFLFALLFQIRYIAEVGVICGCGAILSSTTLEIVSRGSCSSYFNSLVRTDAYYSVIDTLMGNVTAAQSEKKLCKEKVPSFHVHKSNCDTKHYQCHKQSIGFWMPFISANLDIAIRIYSNFSKRSQATNCATFRWMGL